MRQTLLSAAILAAVLTFTTPTLRADVPSTVVIQGRIENSVGQPITGTRGYRVRFFDDETVGFQLGADITGTVVVSDEGRFVLEVTPPAGVLSAAAAFYELAVDSAATPNGVDSADIFAGRYRVNAVPFSMLSADASALAGVDAADYATDSDVTLQNAYDGGGAGAGRTISTTSGAVSLTGTGGLASAGKLDTSDSFRLGTVAGGGTIAAQVARSADGGRLEAYDEAGSRVLNFGAATGGAGGVAGLRMANTNFVGVGVIGDPLGTNAGGQVAVFNGSQNFTSSMTVSSGGAGLIDAYPGNASNIPVTTLGVNSASGGYFQVTDSAGNPRVVAAQLVAGHGVINIMNSSNVVGVQLTGSGTKSFIAQDPTRSDRMIRYVCLEGPEAAMYSRGKATLVDGRVHIDFPSHFAALAAPDTMTVTLTPRSSSSKGLAAENVTASGFDAVELAGGSGAYDVDWVAYAVRAGFEDMPVYIDAEEWRSQFEPKMQERTALPAADVLKAITPQEATP
jgi:hypothetical protein